MEISCTEKVGSSPLMNDQRVGYLSSEQLLFLSPWRPVESDTSLLEGEMWECPNCAMSRSYFRSLARLEGGKQQLMIQCPSCDHLIVVQVELEPTGSITTRFGGPHIDHFLRFLDERSNQEDYADSH